LSNIDGSNHMYGLFDLTN